MIREYMSTDDEASVPTFITDPLDDGYDDDISLSNDSDNESSGSGCFWRGADNIHRQRFFEHHFRETWHRGRDYTQPIGGSMTYRNEVYFNTTICKVLHEGKKAFRLSVAHRDNEVASIVIKLRNDKDNDEYIDIKVTSTITDKSNGVLSYKYSKQVNKVEYVDTGPRVLGCQSEIVTQDDDEDLDDEEDLKISALDKGYETQ